MKNQVTFLIGASLMILGAVLLILGISEMPELQSVGAILLLVGGLAITNTYSRSIAYNTFREAIRDKVLYIILFFTILMIGFSIVLGQISIGETDRVIKHVGLSAINLFGIFLAMFVGVNLVYNELERRTIYTIVAHGVPRNDFIIGKFLGLLLTIFFNFLLMTIILSAVVWMTPEATWHWVIPYAVFMSMFEMMIIIGFAVFFSSFSTPVISAILTLAVYLIGQLSDDLLDYIKILGHQAYAFHSDIMIPLFKGIYMILPHLQEFNARNYAADPEQLDPSLFPIGYGILYSSIILYLACVIFSRKDFR
jgi:hypothetical protein